MAHDHIRGEIAGLPDQTIRLRAIDDTDMRTVDTTVSSGGRFVFETPRVLPRMMFVQMDNIGNFFVPVIVGEGDALISGHAGEPDLLRVSGTPANDDLERYRGSIRDNELTLRAVYVSLAVLAPDDAQRATLENKRDSLRRVRYELRDKFIDDNPGSIVSAYLAWTKLPETMISALRPSDFVRQLVGRLDTTAMADNIFLRRLREAELDALARHEAVDTVSQQDTIP